MKKKKVLKIILICLGALLAVIIAIVGGFLIFASATTLKVKDKEEMAINNNQSLKVDKSQVVVEDGL